MANSFYVSAKKPSLAGSNAAACDSFHVKVGCESLHSESIMYVKGKKVLPTTEAEQQTRDSKNIHEKNAAITKKKQRNVEACG